MFVGSVSKTSKQFFPTRSFFFSSRFRLTIALKATRFLLFFIPMPTFAWIWTTLFLCHFAMNTVHTGAKADNDNNPILIDVVWSEIDYKLHTIPSIQVITNPLLTRQFSPIHKQVFDNLAQLNVDYARYAAWFAYPKLVVAELDPPSGVYQCGHAGENFSVNLSCRQGGGVISRVDFASYGTSIGACGQMKQGTCHATDTLDIVRQVCIGQAECSIPATSDLFGDPCKYRLSYISCRMTFIFRCRSSKATTDSDSM
jgi:hypothetical protein